MALSYTRGMCQTPIVEETIGASFDRVAATYGNAEALVVRHQQLRFTYESLQAEVTRVARGLLALDVRTGDRVGIWGRNCAEWIVTQLAVAKIGAIGVAVNASYRLADLEHVLVHSGTSVLVAVGEPLPDEVLSFSASRHAERMNGATEPSRLPQLRCIVQAATGPLASGATTWSELGSLAETVTPGRLRERSASIGAAAPAAIIYSSGTTGAPKGVTLSHRTLVNAGIFIGERLAYSMADRVCLPVPLTHVFGCVLGTIAVLMRGGAIVLPAPGFDPRACLTTIEQERCTAIYGVPSMFRTILADPIFMPARVATLRTGIMAGAPCPVDLMQTVVSRLHMPQITICYGMTEVVIVCQTFAGDSLEHRLATVGAVHPHVECRIVDPVTGRVVERGEAGELHARGYAVMSGYWNDAESTRAIVDGDGWIRTGDLAVMNDDGYVAIVGRIKDIIISGGRNIVPAEIEDALRQHPAVEEVAVVGVPHDSYGEAVCALIRLKTGASVSAVEIRRFCRRHVAPFKVPRHVQFVEGFPTTPSGKIQKFKLLPLATRAAADRQATHASV